LGRKEITKEFCAEHIIKTVATQALGFAETAMGIKEADEKNECLRTAEEGIAKFKLAIKCIKCSESDKKVREVWQTYLRASIQAYEKALKSTV
jgi:hypothetical protein